MTWTSDKPSSPGWFWYREPGDFNMGKPCPAWVFGSFRSMYATVIAVHSPDPAARTVTKNIKDCGGESEAWWRSSAKRDREWCRVMCYQMKKGEALYGG